MATSQKAQIRPFPSRDLQFRRLVQDIVERQHPAGPDDLAAALHEKHPESMVHERSPFAVCSPQPEAPVWYVFRDRNRGALDG